MVSSIHSNRFFKFTIAILIYSSFLYLKTSTKSFLQLGINNNAEVSLRYLTFGTSVTWGSGLPVQHRLELAYPYLLGENVKNAAIRAAGPNYPSVCTESLAGGGDALYDVIVIEYFRRFKDEGGGVETLARRLRQRFPDALLIFIQDWYPKLIVHHDPVSKQQVDIMQWSKSNNYGATPTSSIFLEKFQKENYRKWYSIFDFDQLGQEYRAIAESVGGYIVELPRPDSFRDLASYMDLFADDWMHLSSKGHEVIAQRIKEVVANVGGNVQQRQRVNQWSYHDDCHMWLETGEVPYSFSGNAFVEKFDDKGKYSLTFPYSSSDNNDDDDDNDAQIRMVNEYDQPLKVYITFMTTGPPPSMYPKTRVSIIQNTNENNVMAVVVDPNIHWTGPDVHITVTKYIGVVLPGEFILEFQPLEQEKELPFRLVSVALNGAEVSSENDEPTFLIGV